MTTPGDENESGEVVRVTVHFSREVVDCMKVAAEREGITVTEFLRRAVGVYGFIAELERDGAEILARKDGETFGVMWIA